MTVLKNITERIAAHRQEIGKLTEMLTKFPTLEEFWTRHSFTEAAELWLEKHGAATEWNEHGETMTIIFGSQELLEEFQTLFPSKTWIE